MILKIKDGEDIQLVMKLNINYELKYIEVTVNLHDKKKHTRSTKIFRAFEFDKALDYYAKLEKMFFEEGEKC